MTDLETKLAHVQDELRKLREQLASAEAAKRDAQHELEVAKKKLTPATPAAAADQAEEERHISVEVQQNTQEKDVEPSAEASPAEEGKSQFDSVEVASPASPAVHPVLEKEDCNGDVMVEVVVKENESREVHVSEVMNREESKEEAAAAAVDVVEAEEAQLKEVQEKAALSELEAKLEETVKELERCLAENASLKQQLAEAEASAAATRTREEEAALRLAHVEQELAGSKSNADQLGKQLEAAEGAKSSLEAEMKKLKVQTEQWRKAADAAVAALSVSGGLGSEANGWRVAERCGSMDKHLHSGEFSGMGSRSWARIQTRGGAGASGRGSACSGTCGRRKASSIRSSNRATKCLLLLLPVFLSVLLPNSYHCIKPKSRLLLL